MALLPIDVTDLRPIRDIVYEHLRRAIMKGHFQPGDRLVESELADRLAVSRTPVREALRMLEKDGIAVAVPRRGTVVAGLKREDAIEIYSILSVLEGLVARQAAMNITKEEVAALRHLKSVKPRPGDFDEYVRIFEQFNLLLLKASRSRRLMQLMDKFAGQLSCLRYVSLETAERQETAWREHIALLDAIESGNPALAEEIARRHVEHARDACNVAGD